MAKAYVSFHPVALKYPNGSSVLGLAEYSSVLDFTSAQATTANAVTAVMDQNRDMVASISVDSDAFIAVGPTPDCDAEAITAATSARVMVQAGSSIDLFIPRNAKVAVKAVA